MHLSRVIWQQAWKGEPAIARTPEHATPDFPCVITYYSNILFITMGNTQTGEPPATSPEIEAAHEGHQQDDCEGCEQTEECKPLPYNPNLAATVGMDLFHTFLH